VEQPAWLARYGALPVSEQLAALYVNEAHLLATTLTNTCQFTWIAFADG